MGKRRFSGLEVTLMVLFALMLIIALALIVLFVTGEPGTIKDETTEVFVPQCPNIPDAERVDCFPDAGASKKGCEQRGCCWHPLDERNVPWCFFPINHGYTVESMEQPDPYVIKAHLKRMTSPSLFGADIQELSFHAEMQSSNRLRFKISDANLQRFEVPHEHVNNLSKNPTSPISKTLEVVHNPFGIIVRRKENRKVLFDTTMGPLVFADQFLQLSAKLPSNNIYGLGEHVHRHFLHDTHWKTWPIFTRDAFPNGGTHNLYGHYPFFLCLEDKSGKSFGVFLMNSNAMEVTLQPAPGVTYRTIGGILDFYIFFGDTPEQVVQEFLELIGRPVIPPYWSLGFQLSRWDYGSLSEVKKTVERNRAVELPYDIQYTDIDYMEDKKDFTYDKVKFNELPQFADYLHEKGQKYILILDPAIATSKRVGGVPYESFDRGTKKNAWVTKSDGKTPLLGEVWPGETVFPDYTSSNCIDWWVDEYERFSQEIKHDALWIDMNEVANFKKGSTKGCDDNNLNYPPYTPKILDEVMYSKTLCMDAKQAWGNHYDVHSLYGYSMVLATEKALQRVFGGNRTLMLTRSSFPGVGKYSGHWLGDNAANWNDIKWAIPGMLEFGLFGIPYIGADICGFFDDSSEELCRRWMQVGAFYPFSRNHNAQGYKPQDPAAYGGTLLESSKHYLSIRYTLLPYLYTLFFKASTTGETVVRPLMHEFYSDEQTWKLDRQFLWGKHLLITPVLDPGVIMLETYIPDALWYDYETMKPLSERRQKIKLHLPGDKLGLHIRGGAVLPTQKPDVTTTYSRRNPMGLIIALDDQGQAAGELFWDDGDSRETFKKGNYILYKFTVIYGVLTMQVIHAGYRDPNNLHFENITILGVPQPPLSASVTHVGSGSHGNSTTMIPESGIHYDRTKKVLFLQHLSLTLGETYLVRWEEVKEEYLRFDCHPEEHADEAKCKARGCIWKESNIERVPWCFYPQDHGYRVRLNEHTLSGIWLDITRNKNSLSSGRTESSDIDNLHVQITYHSNTMLQFKIWDPNTDRYEVPVPLSIPPVPAIDEEGRLYKVLYTTNPFGIQVIRKSTGTKIWDSSAPGFTFSDMFIQVSTFLSSKYIYGFGETEHLTYRHDLNYHTWGMFSKDQPPGYKMNCYGVHPFYMGLEDTNDAHGVLLLNSNAMDVTFQPTPALTYRTVGGILDFYMVLGPTPEMVVQEYTDLIGRPVLPAYWSLGFQLCRYGYTNDSEIADLYKQMRAAEIPYDVQYADIDYMNRQLDFVLDPEFEGLPTLVDNMRKEGMRFIFILDPAISGNETHYPAFERGKAADVFIKWPKTLSDDIVWGKVWPDFPNITVNESLDWDTQVEQYRAFTAFPDFFRNATAKWWHQEIMDFYQTTMKFDGLWIDMNEPASFVHGTVGGNCLGHPMLENPPYMPALESKHLGLNHKTLCMNSEQILSDGTAVRHYDVHSIYGWSHTKPTYEALLNVTGKRGIVVTRSTYPSSGKWAGHWLGDNSANWDQLYKSIIGMMEFSLFGIPYTGADICGFFGKAQYEMCLRWMQLGAFYPYSRNHNGKGNRRQDPVAWDSNFAEASKNVLNIRYTLLPYLYTLMYDAHTKGNTVVRPLLHEFVNDKTTWDIYKQFLWGPALLISPALDPGVTQIEAYVPDDRWYDFHTGKDIKVRGEMILMPAPMDHINLHVRGGYILPWQKPENTTYYSRKNPLGLIVALSDNGTAQGSFFWDDGEGIDTVGKGQYLLTSFAVESNTLSCKTIHNGLFAADHLILGIVQVWGVESTITGVTLTEVDGTEHDLTPYYNADTQVLVIDTTATSVRVDHGFTIRWSASV
ncbi:sucrase-isomaltase, intestinal isoform X2 [Corythoichthys intestinalis]|nr:sucrase-isomaltase, intestinal isoform X2 [Corythoichthys intestinalis]XP_057695528.1 sucrase-isomaltase, intestinal isoform X2 [Corythoichthys intestinalis]XP_057695529.1 sucrase-isomaltase, intestinal isoform X2 [Corythoichthys intestinalis]XP_061796957.1 sucrase-isomaltase, intestinal-like [Nerophis lumbriciformis]